MAIYQDDKYLTQKKHLAFDSLYAAGSRTPHTGIYRCEGCGINVAASVGHPLPPSTHHSHTSLQDGQIRWRLIVAAD